MFATSVLLLAVLGSPPQSATAGESNSPQQAGHSFVRSPQHGLRATNPATKLDFTVQSSGATTIQTGKTAIVARLDRIGRGNVTESVAGIAPTLRQTTDANGWPMAQIQRPGVTEEYRNYQNAMRHYIHIAQKPTGNNGDLTVRVSLTGVDKVVGGGQSITILTSGKTLLYENLKVWDARNRPLAARIEPDGNGFRFVVEDQSATYPVTIDPDWLSTGRLYHPTQNTNPGLQYGYSYGSEGDTLAVGAPRDTSADGLTTPGALHIYRRVLSGWTHEQKLFGGGSASVEEFGRAIAITYDPTPGDTQGQLMAVATRFDVQVFRKAPAASTFTYMGSIPGFGGQTDKTMKFVGRRLVLANPTVEPGGKISLISYRGGTWEVVSEVVGEPQDSLGESISFDGETVIAAKHRGLVIFSTTGDILTPLGQHIVNEDHPYFTASGNDVFMAFPTQGRGRVERYSRSGGSLEYKGSLENHYEDGPDGDGGSDTFTHFGEYLAMQGNRLAVFTRRRRTYGSRSWNEGLIFIYTVSSTGVHYEDITGTHRNPTESPHLLKMEPARLIVSRSSSNTTESSANFVEPHELQALGITFPGLSAVGGKNATGQITLLRPAPPGGERVFLYSNDGTIAVPPIVTVPEGATSASFSVGTTPVASEQSARVTGFSNSSGGGYGDLRILKPRVGGISANLTECALGASLELTITLQAPAGPGGVDVNLSHNGGTAVTLPSTVNVPAGTSRVKVQALVGALTSVSQLTFVATPSYQPKTVTVNIVARKVVKFTSEPILLPGNRLMASIELDANALPSGQVVHLSNPRPDLLTMPTTVTVPANTKVATFEVAAAYPEGPLSGNILVQAGVRPNEVAFTYYCRQRFLVEVTVAPTVVVGGNSAVGSVRISHPAAPGGTVVMMKSLKPTLVMVPSSVTVPAGQITATFPVTTAARNSDTALVTTLIGNLPNLGTKGAKITVTRPSVTSVTLNPATVVGGNISTGTVTLNGPAATGGILVTLASQKPTIAQVPATVLVPAGATSVNFTITTVPIASGSVKSTISARIGTDGTRGSALTVTAP